MAATVHIACLCAAWCRTCDAYAAVFERVIDDLDPGRERIRLHWIDIEDEDELVGDLDIETFPTIVVADAQHVRFAGPVTPEAETLSRLLRAHLEPAGATRPPSWPPVSTDVEALAARLRERNERRQR